MTDSPEVAATHRHEFASLGIGPSERETEANHEHEFDDAAVNTVRMCVDRRCTVLHVRTADGWRPLTPNEQTEATILMWEDLIIADTMRMIHGEERGIEHARRVLGNGDNV